MLEPGSESSTADERKLWFEYIKTVNERQLQTTQRSGITTYVLLATLVGLLYRFGPQVPQFITEPDDTRVGITISVLLAIVVSSLFMATLSVGLYCAGDTEFRAVPRSSEALVRAAYGLFALIGVAFICLEVWVASADPRLTKFGKYFLFAHAAWLVFSLAYPVVQYRRLAKKAKEIKNILPRFSPFRTPPWVNLFGLALGCIWLVFGSIILLSCLGPLPNYGLRPFKAASVSLIMVLILSYMFLRSIASVTQQKYFGLERDIVLSRMTPAEIRSRYLSELSGPDMAQWLDDALVGLGAREERLRRAEESAREQLQEIGKINAEYRAEQSARATPIIKDLVEAMDECVSQLELLNTQTSLFFNTYMTKEEISVFKVKFMDCDKRFKDFVQRRNEQFLPLLEKLKQLVE